MSSVKEIGDQSTIQGSVLAGILYLLYTLDFPSFFHNQRNSPTDDINSCEPTMITFVDDTNSTIKQKGEIDLQITMKENLSKTEDYTNANHLMLNKTKTKIFAITKNKDIADNLSLPSDTVNKPIKNNKTINMLGMRINEDLKMNMHVITGNKSLINQLNLRLIALKKLVKVSDQKFSKQLAN